MTQKNPAAVELGRLGGLKRVPKGFAALTPEERSVIAQRGVEARREKQRKTKAAAKKKGG